MDNTYNKLTIGDYIEMFLQGEKKATAALKEIYSYVKKFSPETAEETIRCAIYRDRKNRFKRVAKGVYMLIGKESTGLIINGDGRNLSEIEDNSMDAIITDHPYYMKSHRSGNQKEFAKYEKFRYVQEDFNQKARVLKDGCFLAEFLPVESQENYEYLYEIKQMAKKAGLNYYAKIQWQKDLGKNRHNGRMTKEFEEIMIFYKGKKPRKLSEDRVNAYQTRKMLPFQITTFFAAKGKQKHHDSEKPIELYEFLLDMLTEKNEMLLDQFGGSCNFLKAAINTGRFAIVYEKCTEFVKKAVARFNCITLYDEEDETLNDEVIESNDVGDLIIQTIITEAEVEKNRIEEASAIEVETIPNDVIQFQLKFLNTIKEKRTFMLNEKDLDKIEKANEELFSIDSNIINELFNKVVKLGYENYSVPQFDISLESYIYLNQMEMELNKIFDNKFTNKYLKNYYFNYKLETRAFIEFCISKERILDFNSIRENLNNLVNKYINYIKVNYNNLNYNRSLKILSEFLY